MQFRVGVKNGSGMKKKYFTRKALKAVFVTLSMLVMSWQSYSQCPTGNVVISNQGDLNQFASQYNGCNTIQGNLIISGNGILNLSALEGITTVTGSVTISNCQNISSLNGLNGLEQIGGYLSITGNSSLTDINGLNNLQTIGSYLNIGFNPGIVSIAGFNNLNSIGSFFNIFGNSSLISIEGFDSLGEINGVLGIYQNNELSDMSGLSSIDSFSITELRIQNNPSLSVCSLSNICTYLHSNKPRVISGNDEGCASEGVLFSICSQNFLMFFADLDGDSFGDSQNVVMASVQPNGYVLNGDDCNDQNNKVFPGAVEECYDGIDNNCDGVIDNGCAPISMIQPSQCGITLGNISDYIYAINVVGAQGYRFKVRDVLTDEIQEITRFTRALRLSEMTNFDFERTYEISVTVKLNNVWLNSVGGSCTISTPTAYTQVTELQCGGTVGTLTDYVYANIVPFVTGYKFRVTNLTNPNQYFEVESPIRNVRFSQFSNITFDSNYIIEVALKKRDGDYMDYGLACLVSTPLFPTTTLVLNNCDAIVGPNQTIYVNSLPKVSAYRVVITDGVVTESADFYLRAIDLKRFTILQPGREYSVGVQVMIDGVWGPLGKQCSILIANGAREIVTENEFDIKAYPNPTTNQFYLNAETLTDEPTEVVIYDALGRLVETREIIHGELEFQSFGQNYAAGIYHVVINQGVNSKNVRVIKK